jgi:hypothetical protein
MNTAAKLVDFCFNNKGTPFDVAQVAQEVLKGRFRYKGDNVWEMLAEGATEWKTDDNRTQLETSIKVDVCQVFMERALYWQEQSMCNDMSEKIDCQIRSHKLLEICLKMRKDKFIKDVQKELRAFLSVD